MEVKQEPEDVFMEDHKFDIEEYFIPNEIVIKNEFNTIKQEKDSDDNIPTELPPSIINAKNECKYNQIINGVDIKSNLVQTNENKQIRKVMNSNVYRWCAVPLCKNTSIKTPEKIFVNVPMKKAVRDVWLNLARRDPATVSSNSVIYLCEDHFDLPNDMENYIQYLVMGTVSQVRMKSGCVPTKFECQLVNRKRTSKTKKQPYVLKKRRKTLIEENEKYLEEKSTPTNYLEHASTSSKIPVLFKKEEMEPGFQKADTYNLPCVDVEMLYDFMALGTQFSSGFKTVRSGREHYGDSAVGYVQIKKEGDLCIVRGQIYSENKIQQNPYNVICHVNEVQKKIDHLSCLDCVAATAGGCKHSLAFLMWLHRRSEEAAPTSVVCYWKQPVLSQVDSNLKFMKAVKIVKTIRKTEIEARGREEMLDDVINMTKKHNYICPISTHTSEPTGAKTLSLHHLMRAFLRTNIQHTAENFINFCSEFLTDDNIENACALSHTPNENSLWYELRYGRISASKLYDIAVCKSAKETLVTQIMGVTKQFKNSTMKRGVYLEALVIKELEKRLKCTIQCSGFTVLKKYGVIGASPDGITKDFVIEVKCPVADNSVSRYIDSQGNITKKFLAQINLQMLASGVDKGVFCIADPKFENTRQITVVHVDYDAAFTESLIECSLHFWKKNIFPILYEICR